MDLSNLSPDQLHQKISDASAYLEQFLDTSGPEGSELDAIADGIETGLSAIQALLSDASEAQLDALEAELKRQGLL